MPLTNHTTSLELSIALKKAGWPQEESLFYWVNPPDGSWHLQSDGICGGFDCDVPRAWRDGGEAIASPTASELMQKIGSAFNEWSMGYDDSGCYYRFFYGGRGAGGMVEGCGGSFSVLDLGGEDEPENTPTNALAKLALHLIQEGIIKF